MKKYLVKILFSSSDVYLCHYFDTFEHVLLWLRQFKYNSVEELIVKDISNKNSVKPLKFFFDEK